MEKTQLVLIERDGPVATLTLNRPEVLNALNPALLAALCAALDELEEDPGIRAIVLTGTGRAFAAGSDIAALSQLNPLEVVQAGNRRYWERLQRANKPLIAAVNGYAYGGGCELALLCDLIVAAEGALFAQPEIKLGIMPGAGGTQRLARAIGPYRAMEMILTGEPLSAREAYALGLVNRLVPGERCLAAAQELAATIAARPAVAVRLAREAVRFGVANTVQAGLEVERRNYALLYASHDQAEGMAAFLEKRSPDFEHA